MGAQSGAKPWRVAVIGAGMAGLTAAYRLQQAGAQVEVFEREPVAGGRVATVRKNGFVIDTGAILLSAQYQRTLALVGELGLQAQLQSDKPVMGVFRDGRVHELDLGQPLTSFWRWGALSASAKLGLLRVLPDLLRHWQRCTFRSMAPMAVLDDEDCRSYTLRVLGQELHDYFVDPLIRVNMFTETQLTPAADLIWLLRIFSDARVFQLRGGMNSLPAALQSRLKVHLAQPVSRVQANEAGVSLQLADGTQQAFDAAVLAVPPPVALELADWVDGARRRYFEGAQAIRSVGVSFGLRQAPASRAAMVMVPGVELPQVLGAVLQHHKAPDRAPDGQGLVTLHLTQAWYQALPAQDDATVVAAALPVAERLFGPLAAQVVTTHVHRWPYVDGTRGPGCYKTLARMQQQAMPPRVAFAGEYISAGIEGAVISGEAAAVHLLDAR